MGMNWDKVRRQNQVRKQGTEYVNLPIKNTKKWQRGGFRHLRPKKSPARSTEALFVPSDMQAVICLECGHMGLIMLEYANRKLRCTSCRSLM